MISANAKAPTATARVKPDHIRDATEMVDIPTGTEFDPFRVGVTPATDRVHVFAAYSPSHRSCRFVEVADELSRPDAIDAVRTAAWESLRVQFNKVLVRYWGTRRPVRTTATASGRSGAGMGVGSE